MFGIAFGAAVGSFLNVLIYRLPRRLSIVFPPSHCPGCQHRLGIPDLVPILSYLIQRGRCRYCGVRISPRYMWVEVANASLWGWLWWQWLIVGEMPLRFVFFALASSVLIAIFVIDLLHYIIPDELNVALLVLGLLHALMLSGQPTDWSWASIGQLSLRNAVLSAFWGTLLFCAIALIGRIAFKRDAMGHGDIKLARAMGALLLLPGMLVAFALSIVTGAILGGLWTYLRRRAEPHTTETAESEPEPLPPPEPIGGLLLMSGIYLLWVDALITLLPFKLQTRIYASIGQPEEESLEDTFEELPGMLPYGPFLVLGTLAVMLFGQPLAEAVRAYLEWAGF
ncbi:MAG: prepilin peptidase [Fimbriimonadales bacterium]